MLRHAFILAAGLSSAALAANRGIPAATPIGAPIDCVQLTQIDHTSVRDDSTIDFYLRGGKVYRNVLPQSCPELGFEQSFSYETSLSKLCNVDIITVLRRAGGIQRGASCGLGQFQPVTLTGATHAN